MEDCRCGVLMVVIRALHSFSMPAPLARHSEALKAYSGPVAYFAGDRVAVDMSKIAAHLREQSELCRRPINA